MRLDDQRSTVLDAEGVASISMEATSLVLAFLEVEEGDHIQTLYDCGGACYEYLPAREELVLRFSIPW